VAKCWQQKPEARLSFKINSKKESEIGFELNKVLLDCEINPKFYPTASKFWLKLFRFEKNVNFDEFCQSLHQSQCNFFPTFFCFAYFFE
jgi:hypothetical protein